MAHRYAVDDLTDCQPWLTSPWRQLCDPRLLAVLELDGVADPEHWWVSDTTVRAVWDRTWSGAPAAAAT